MKICPITFEQCTYIGCNPNNELCHYPRNATNNTIVEKTEDLWNEFQDFVNANCGISDYISDEGLTKLRQRYDLTFKNTQQ